MKICFYDGDMNINRKYEKKYVEIQKKKKKKKRRFFRKQNGWNIFSSLNVLKPYGLFS